MKQLKVKRIIGLSARLSIINQDTGAVSPWVMNDEQKEALALVVDHPRAIVLKGRQIGLSTVMLLLVLTFAVANPGVPACIVADTRDKAQGLLGRLAGWCAQLGIGMVEKNKGSITLANGSVIDALSAVSRADGGESRVGRSKSYGLIHCSELAFWLADAAVFRGLTSTALPGARIVVESTASAADNLFRQLWTGGDGSEWARVFLSIERHIAYRRDERDIDDATWEMLQGQKYGFTRRDAAAWWWVRMRTDFGGDEQGALREFPVLPAHCFSFARGRWIMRYTEATPVADGVWEKDRFSGWHHYEHHPNEPVCFGVDVAAGHGGDSSSLVVLGLLTGTIHATWMDHSTSLPDLIELIKDAGEKYKPSVCIVEFNGVGIPVYEALHQMSNLHVEKQVSGAEKHYRLQRLKMAIEMGVVPIGPELIAEAKSSHIEPPSGPKGQPSYEGRDDCLNALSFAREWYLSRLPMSSPVDLTRNLDHEKVFHSSQRMKRKFTEHI